MISLFSHAAGSDPLQGAWGDFERIHAGFVQEERSGMVVVNLGPEARQIYLYLNGQVFAAYEQSNRTRVALERLGDDWLHPSGPAAPPIHAQNMTLRAANLPDQAVRAAWQALDWYPPQRSETLDLADMGAYLEGLRAEGGRGLLQITTPDLDGFVLVWEGQPVSHEITLASAQGFIEVPPEGRGPAQVWWSEALPASPVRRLTDLRVAFRAWVNAWLGSYQQLVGNNLLLGLDHSANTWLRQHRQNLRLSGLLLVDHHLYLQSDDALHSYQALASFLGRQMGRVIGDQLTARTASEAEARLKPPQQAILQSNHLGSKLSQGGA